MGEFERRVFPMLQHGQLFAALCSAVDVDGDDGWRSQGASIMEVVDGR